MRTAITIGIHVGGAITELLVGPETPINEHRAAIKKLVAAGGDARKCIESVEMWQSDCGRVIKHRFKGVAAAPATSEYEAGERLHEVIDSLTADKAALTQENEAIKAEFARLNAALNLLRDQSGVAAVTAVQAPAESIAPAVPEERAVEPDAPADEPAPQAVEGEVPAPADEPEPEPEAEIKPTGRNRRR
jgi:cell division protein FtsB